jgi:putative multiple sugar transport system substrate-binding protein
MTKMKFLKCGWMKLVPMLLSAAMLTGCSASETVADRGNEAGAKGAASTYLEEAKTDADSQPKKALAESDGLSIGIAMPEKSLERWNRDGNFLKKQFEAKGYQVYLTYAEDGYEQQIDNISHLIESKVDLLVVAAVDGNALSDVLSRAKDADIPVISYDRLIMNTDAISYYVSFDNYKVGTLQGQYVVDALQPETSADGYNIEFTAGDPMDNNAAFYYNGAYSILAPYIASGKLRIHSGQNSFAKVSTAGWSTDTAMHRFQNILRSFYADGTSLDAVVCSNDSTAYGVTQAIASDYTGTNAVVITGQDGDDANMKNIVDGKQSMTVFKAVANEAIVTFYLADAILNGETPDEQLIADANWDFNCVYDTKTYDNGTGAIPSYLLEPVTVTKENMKEILVDTGYYTTDTEGYLHPIG